mgnify:FL=1
MKFKKNNFDYFLLRHIIFFYGELKATILTDNYFSLKKFKKLRRFYIRYISNYYEGFKYLVFGKKIISNLVSQNLSLNKLGYEILSPIDTAEIDFIKESKNNEKSVINHKIIDLDKGNNFALSKGFHEIAFNFFNEEECFFEIEAWETLSFSSRESLQNSYWHRDRDGFKVMKIFIYLDDVTDECGPHEYASYSNNIKPLKFVPQIRYQDKNVKKYFHDIKKFVGKKGMCFVVDTTGLHRANPPQNNKTRSVLQFIYYTGSIFWNKEKSRLINR